MRLLLLEHYRRSGKQKPQALVWYRDGVSEGQFPECSRVEVSSGPKQLLGFSMQGSEIQGTSSLSAMFTH